MTGHGRYNSKVTETESPQFHSPNLATSQTVMTKLIGSKGFAADPEPAAQSSTVPHQGVNLAVPVEEAGVDFGVSSSVAFGAVRDSGQAQQLNGTNVTSDGSVSNVGYTVFSSGLVCGTTTIQKGPTMFSQIVLEPCQWIAPLCLTL